MCEPGITGGRCAGTPGGIGGRGAAKKGASPASAHGDCTTAQSALRGKASAGQTKAGRGAGLGQPLSGARRRRHCRQGITTAACVTGPAAASARGAYPVDSAPRFHAARLGCAARRKRVGMGASCCCPGLQTHLCDKTEAHTCVGLAGGLVRPAPKAAAPQQARHVLSPQEGDATTLHAGCLGSRSSQLH